MNIKFICVTWGMSSVADIVNEVVGILNTKEWSEEEAKKIDKMFNDIADSMESLKEGAWGEDA